LYSAAQGASFDTQINLSFCNCKLLFINVETICYYFMQKGFEIFDDISTVPVVGNNFK